MDTIFDLCVYILIITSKMLGMTYNELNVILFVIIHPIITIIFIYLTIKYRSKYKLSEMRNNALYTIIKSDYNK